LAETDHAAVPAGFNDVPQGLGDGRARDIGSGGKQDVYHGVFSSHRDTT